MSQYDIKPPAVPQLRIYTMGGPIAMNLRAYHIQSDMVVSYIQVDSDIVETNLGPCQIANSVGFKYRENEIEERMKATLDSSSAP